MLVGHGYRLESRSSDWRIDADEAGLQRELIEGLAAAAAAMAPDSEARLASWRRRRLEFVRLGTSRITVGHQDLLGRLG
jgi:tellurite resistance protein